MMKFKIISETSISIIVLCLIYVYIHPEHNLRITWGDCTIVLNGNTNVKECSEKIFQNPGEIVRLIKNLDWQSDVQEGIRELYVRRSGPFRLRETQLEINPAINPASVAAVCGNSKLFHTWLQIGAPPYPSHKFVHVHAEEIINPCPVDLTTNNDEVVQVNGEVFTNLFGDNEYRAKKVLVEILFEPPTPPVPLRTEIASKSPGSFK